MNPAPPSFVEIEYLDGTCTRVNKSDVKLLINKNNENKRKYVHYWTPDGDSEPSDFSNMDSLKKFKASPINNTKQKGLYYCQIVEKPQPGHFIANKDEMTSNESIERTIFKPEPVVLDCETMFGHDKNSFNYTSNQYTSGSGIGAKLHGNTSF